MCVFVCLIYVFDRAFRDSLENGERLLKILLIFACFAGSCSATNLFPIVSGQGESTLSTVYNTCCWPGDMAGL